MPAPQQMRRADSPGLMEGLQSPGHSSRTGACGLAKESVNYIYAGVCLSMVIAVIVLAVLLGQATFSLHHAHDHDHVECTVHETCDTCAGVIGLTGKDTGDTSPCMWCPGNQTCGYKSPERRQDCLHNWGGDAVMEQHHCNTRVLFECNHTRTTAGCSACPDCCEDYIPDGKSCDECVAEKCNKDPDTCNHVLHRLCGLAKSTNLKACNDCLSFKSNHVELQKFGCTSTNITSFCKGPDQPLYYSNEQ